MVPVGVPAVGVVEPDGEVVIGGQFTSYNGTLRNRIARLNPDGTLDASFGPGSGADCGGIPSWCSVWAVAVQDDSKVLIGGDFATFNGTSRIRTARLNADGRSSGGDPHARRHHPHAQGPAHAHDRGY